MVIQANHLINPHFFASIEIERDLLQTKSCLGTALYQMGQSADAFASLDRQKWIIKPGHLAQINVDGYAWKTALKVVAYISSAFVLLFLALAAKALYRHYCLKQINQTLNRPNPEQESDVIMTKKLKIKALKINKAFKISSKEELLFVTKKFFEILKFQIYSPLLLICPIYPKSLTITPLLIIGSIIIKVFHW
ncbi:MAG: hypothetical protein HWD61_05495 [Parachlamydiaceae bacterium]|nr:MAG: hypothetical protein HWD61_05495 [Parachlamydiaceae bacterium]